MAVWRGWPLGSLFVRLWALAAALLRRVASLRFVCLSAFFFLLRLRPVACVSPVCSAFSKTLGPRVPLLRLVLRFVFCLCACLAAAFLFACLRLRFWCFES